MSGLVCLYFGNASECQCCGGWTRADGGPFEPDPRFCSQDCAETIYERQARAREYAENNWCPECGYDNFEHAAGCVQQSGVGSVVIREPLYPLHGIKEDANG